MRRVLVDTGALIALSRESDAYHTRAVDFFGEFRDGELLTTAAVLTEAMHLLPLALFREYRGRYDGVKIDREALYDRAGIR